MQLRRRMGTMGLDLARKMMGVNVYVSEGRDAKVLGELEGAARVTEGVALVHSFVDAPYHRTGYTLASPDLGALGRAAVRLSEVSLQQIDLRIHQANHPRLGAVDHISCHPVGADAELQDAAELANAIGAELGGGGGVPVCMYGAAHPKGRPLADVRRALGYFAGGGLVVPTTAESDYGPKDMVAARAIARGTSEKGRGLPSVQAMALEHADGIEIACNLLDPAMTGPSAVLARVEELAAAGGIAVGGGYETGITPERVIQVAEGILRAGSQ